MESFNRKRSTRYPRGSQSADQRLSTPTVMSFFSGCGGLDLGFLGGFTWKNIKYPRLPFDVLQAHDHDEQAIQTYNKNIPGAHGIVSDLAEISAEELPKANILIGGFPCQDFSSCGPKRGLESDRGQLYKVLTRYMDVHNPPIVIGENVPHLARMGRGSVIQKILADLEKAGRGYKFEVWDLYAPDFGVPQRRNRLFFVGVRCDVAEEYGMPLPPQPKFLEEPRSIDWAIGDLIDVMDSSIPNQDQYFKASKAKRGNGQGDETNKSGFPSYTIRANAKSRVHFHYELPRRLTVRECARLQTFPDKFVFEHSATTNIMQIGNAVPPILGHSVAKQISKYIAGLSPKVLGDSDDK